MNISPNHQPLRIAVVGAGLVGRRHIDAIRHAEGIELGAIVDPDEAAADLARQAGARFHPDLDALLVERAVDGIILATPNTLHVAQGLDCIAAGIPLLVEKPIAVSTAEAGRLVAAARRAAIPLLVGHHRRHNPVIHDVKTLLDAGRLGELRVVHASCWFFKPRKYFDEAPWRKQAGAGPIFVNLIHDVDLLRYLCGEVASVQAQLLPSARGYENEEVAAVLLRFASDVVATLSVADSVVAPWNWEMTAAENPAYPFTGQGCYLLGGTRGALSIPDLTLWRQDEPDWWQPLQRESLASDSREDPLRNQLDHFARVIRGVEEPLVSGEEGAASLRVIEAIHESAATRSTIYPGT